MRSFKDLLNETQVHDVNAYGLSGAEESAHSAVNYAPAPGDAWRDWLEAAQLTR